uniref:Uncharacterized protein n=1 Tax=Florenciella sp. virus SA2 TaxID=3240092 RepID=A0AB39JFZ8_9VIRU
MKKYINKKQIHLSLSPSKVIEKIKSKFTIKDDDVKQSIIEEAVANVSSSLFVASFTLAAGGGIAIFAHPVAGTIIFAVSIVYSSYMKIYAGKYYQKKIKKNKIYNINNNNLEESLINLFKNWQIETKSKIPYIRSKTSNYALVKIHSKIQPLENKNINNFHLKGKSNKIMLDPLPQNQ